MQVVSEFATGVTMNCILCNTVGINIPMFAKPALAEYEKMSVARSRILDLMKVRCRIFSTTFNPEGLRTGNKVLRQRLKGHALAAYYPRKMFSFKQFRSAWPDFEMYDEDELDRLEAVDRRKARGKGPPKKRRTAAESKKLKGKKR